MKPIRLFACLALLFAPFANAANVLIRDLATSIVLPAANTYSMFDGATQGTGKFLLANYPLVTSTRTTLAALSVTNVSTGITVQTLGGSAVADGNATLYYYNSTSTATPNGTTVIQPSVGSGRWLIVSSSALPAPTPSSLGGVFSLAPAANYFVTGIGTDGTPSVAIVSAANVSGLGTMATQNSTAVAITGGTLSGITSLAGTAQTFTGNSYLGNLVLKSNQVNETATNGLAQVSVNYDGYNGGTTQFRNLVIYDGKNAAVATFTGSTKAFDVVGALSAASASLTTPLPLASGGLGAATAAGGRTTLGVTATGADTTYAYRANNLSDLASVSTARANLGVTATGADVTYAFRANNLSDLANAGTARTNLGLGSMATQASGAVTITGGTINAGVTATGGTTSITLANRFAQVVNVKDFGAVGDNSTNDTTAINNAIAALTNFSCLYFPKGSYVVTPGSISGLSSLSHIRITGDGARLYSAATGAPGNFLVINSSCSNVDIDNLAIVGSATVRGNGVGIRLYSANSSVTNCYITGTSDFAIHVSNSGSAYTAGARIENNTIYAPLGDGIHFGNATDFLCSGNNLRNTGDDAIAAIADSVSFPPLRGQIIGNQVYNSGSAGVRLNEVTDVLVSANVIDSTVAAGIEVNRYTSTTTFNYRVSIKGNVVEYSTTSPGPRAAIWMNFCEVGSVEDNTIISPQNGAGICLLDFSTMIVKGNTIFGTPTRSIIFDDTTTANVRTTWVDLMITGNNVEYCISNEAIYLVPASGISLDRFMVVGNNGRTMPAGNWIYYDRASNGKVGNNTALNGQTVAGGGSVSAVTTFNNN